MDALITLLLADRELDAALDALDEAKAAAFGTSGFNTRQLPCHHPAVLRCRAARTARARALQNPALNAITAASSLDALPADRLDHWAPRAAEILISRGENALARGLLSLLAWAQDAEKRAGAPA
jgi:hypothetical protein